MELGIGKKPWNLILGGTDPSSLLPNAMSWMNRISPPAQILLLHQRKKKIEKVTQSSFQCFFLNELYTESS